jgi:hypothetical protein
MDLDIWPRGKFLDRSSPVRVIHIADPDLLISARSQVRYCEPTGRCTRSPMVKKMKARKALPQERTVTPFISCSFLCCSPCVVRARCLFSHSCCCALISLSAFILFVLTTCRLFHVSFHFVRRWDRDDLTWDSTRRGREASYDLRRSRTQKLSRRQSVHRFGVNNAEFRVE